MSILRRRSKHIDGLTPMWCSNCGRYLDQAQPDFIAKFPEPKCGQCANRSDDSDSS